MATRPRTAILALAAVAVIPALAACSKKGSTTATKVAITSTDSTCDVGRTALAGGSTTFAITNKGSKTTEVYVYGLESGGSTKIVGEVEDIGPGTSRDLKVDLGAGSYEVVCKPGQKGDGIRTKVTVTGAVAASQPTGATGATGATFDRKIELATDGAAITGLSGGAKVGEKIEFKLTNNAKAPRALEVKDPSGAVAGVSQPIATGATGEFVVELAKAGSWKINVEGAGVEDVTVELTVA